MKRVLTTTEINQILDEFDKQKLYQNIPKATRDAMLLQIKDNVKEQLVKIKIFPNGIENLKNDIIKYYHSTQIEAGASVGIVTAQSIGERQTQMTLNTFHSAGMAIATVITGVPRFGELLNATTNPKMVSCQIYFKNDDEDLDTLRRYIGSDLRQFTLKDLTINYKTGYKEQPESWFQTYLLFNDIDASNICGTSETTEYMCFTVILDPKILYEYIISLKTIAQKISDEYEDIIVIPSPIDKHQLDIFIDTSQVTNGDEFESLETAYQLYMDNVVVPSLFEIVVCGIPGINNFFFKRYNEDDKFLKSLPDNIPKSGWMVETQGSNYIKLLAHPKIKTNIVISNNMWDIYDSLGIEAARQFLIDEFMNVVSSDGTYINICHVMLLVDLMTFSGTIASISRYGIKRDQAGPLAKASFEESLDNFLKAGVFGDVETTKGVSASIMCGKRSKIGSGLCDLLYCIDGSGPSNQKHTLSTDPIKETNNKQAIFTDLSKWLHATRKLSSVDNDDDDYEDDSIDNMSDLSEVSGSDAQECDDDPDESKSDSSINQESLTNDDISDVDDTDLIFDDNEMDGFMDII
jgi:DNA-directed RNA polymerase beta' subunit